MKLNKFSNKEHMSRAVVAYAADLINTNIDSGKIFNLALSGGSSPIQFYELLAEEKIDWSMVNIFLVDERNVPSNHKFSNFRMIKESLLSKIDIPLENIFPVKTELKSAAECALEYEEQIKKVFGNSSPVFDLVVLGVGPDGHTASLFPGKDYSTEGKEIFIASKAPPQFDVSERLTMTLALINAAAQRIFVISGVGKGEIINRVLNLDRNIPAGLINPESTIFTDSREL